MTQYICLASYISNPFVLLKPGEPVTMTQCPSPVSSSSTCKAYCIFPAGWLCMEGQSRSKALGSDGPFSRSLLWCPTCIACLLPGQWREPFATVGIMRLLLLLVLSFFSTTQGNFPDWHKHTLPSALLANISLSGFDNISRCQFGKVKFLLIKLSAVYVLQQVLVSDLSEWFK